MEPMAIIGGSMALANFLKKPPQQPPTVLGRGRGIQVVQQPGGKSLQDILGLGISAAEYQTADAKAQREELAGQQGLKTAQQAALDQMYSPKQIGLEEAQRAAVNQMFPPERQYGGPVAQGQPYTVGEAGPELFVPKLPGMILPNPNTGIADNSYNRLTGLLGNPGNSMRPMFTNPNFRGMT